MKLNKHLSKGAKEKEKMMKTSSKEREAAIKTTMDKQAFFQKKETEHKEACGVISLIDEGMRDIGSFMKKCPIKLKENAIKNEDVLAKRWKLGTYRVIFFQLLDNKWSLRPNREY